LNAVYEYEQTAADREILSNIESNMTFKEGNGGTNDSSDNLSSSAKSSSGRGRDISQ